MTAHLEPGAACLRSRLRAVLRNLLREATPADFDVSTGCLWYPDQGQHKPASVPTGVWSGEREELLPLGARSVHQSHSSPFGRSVPATLQPDVLLHHPLGVDGRLDAPPVLSVELGALGTNGRQAQSYARLGVDHYWLVDLGAGVVEVSVRTEDEFRHAETVRSEPAWIDFGVGIVRFDLPALLRTVAVAGEMADAEADIQIGTSPALAGDVEPERG